MCRHSNQTPGAHPSCALETGGAHTMSAIAFAKPRRRHMMWLPAALLVTFGALSAAGVTVAPDSNAGSTVGTISVNAEIGENLTMVFSACGNTQGGASSVTPAGTANA